jgi:hypothetical protein
MKASNFLNNSGTWIIYGSRLLQRQGSGPHSCSELPQVGYNEADVVRSARPWGKNGWINNKGF